MFRYKNAKYKSNYLKVQITAGTDYEAESNSNGITEPVCLHKTECTLVFPLFPGEHTISARCEAGNIGNEPLVGETVVHYKYQDGNINVCDYDFIQKDCCEKNQYDTPPVFRLLRKQNHAGRFGEEQPLLEVSSRKDVQIIQNSTWMHEAAAGIRAQLRTIHSEIKNALFDTGIYLTVHMEDVIEEDITGNAFTGTYLGITHNWQNYFYNICDSTHDLPENRHFAGGWIAYYHAKVIAYCNANGLTPSHNVANHRYCAAYLAAFGCTPSSSSTAFVGGHILTQLRNYAHMTNTIASVAYTPLTKDGHEMPRNRYVRGGQKYVQNEEYYMLPICKKHNNTYNVIMYPNHAEDLLHLIGFKPNDRY